MKAKTNVVISLMLVLLLACGLITNHDIKTNANNDSMQSHGIVNQQPKIEKQNQIDEKEYNDSLRLDKVLKDALKIANQNFGKNKFKKKFKVSIDSLPISVEINIDYHFTKLNPHLIIRRSDPNNIYFDIYTKVENIFKKVLSHEQWTLEYVNDTIKDINGDGLNDFVVNSYGASGCCLKAFSNVYLLRQDQKAFSENFEFINPTFSPKEQIIRGVCYGHPGETEMYKYKWNGEKVDTLEYVSYQTKIDDSSIKTGKIEILSSKYKAVKILKEIPIEYRKIEGFEWFTGKGYN